MGATSFTQELTCPIAPARIIKALIVESNTLIPKLLPQFIKSVDFGSQYKTMKHKVEALNKENFTYSYSIIEGDALGTTLEKISYEMKITASPEGGSVCKRTSKYFTIGEADITEEKIKAGKEKASAMFKAIEAYLLANPDAY
ncbi:hypothetical protein ACJRO7_000421 [Eucalyptus globulus]|uniref:Bet v I/Major latex protein domain-containing protein n=1 Tax=Eucalyptus globulus TaxID=34317 RepID=A0ABD3LQV5_EUCGL